MDFYRYPQVSICPLSPLLTAREPCPSSRGIVKPTLSWKQCSRKRNKKANIYIPLFLPIRPYWFLCSLHSLGQRSHIHLINILSPPKCPLLFNSSESKGIKLWEVSHTFLISDNFIIKKEIYNPRNLARKKEAPLFFN